MWREAPSFNLEGQGKKFKENWNRAEFSTYQIFMHTHTHTYLLFSIYHELDGGSDSDGIREIQSVLKENNIIRFASVFFSLQFHFSLYMYNLRYFVGFNCAGD